MRKRTAFSLILLLVVLFVSSVFFGLPSPVGPNDFSGTANSTLLYQWVSEIERLEEKKSAWWLPSQRQARHYYYGRRGEQLVWLEVLRTEYRSSAAAEERFQAFKAGFGAGRLVVEGQAYEVAHLGGQGGSVSGLVISYGEKPVGVRLLQLSGAILIRTTLVGIFPSNEEERAKLLVKPSPTVARLMTVAKLE